MCSAFVLAPVKQESAMSLKEKQVCKSYNGKERTTWKTYKLRESTLHKELCYMFGHQSFSTRSMVFEHPLG